MTAEETLRTIEERSALLREFAFMAAHSPSFSPSRNVLNGLGEVCDEIRELAEEVRRGLSVQALNTDLEL
jgi:hypothetical protein